MNILYLDCAMGAAGDMLGAALAELLPDPSPFLSQMNSMGLPGLSLSLEKTTRCGILGTRMVVSLQGEEPHGSHPADIAERIRLLRVSDHIKEQIRAVYDRIARAESEVHGVPVRDIHFHELGTKDALADIAAFCLLIDALRPDRILCSPVTTGFGQVRTGHGILPVPAPATACLLLGIPTRRGEIEGELCTPTGAALLGHFVHSFGEPPVLVSERVGYGMGAKDFPAANCVRATWAQTQEAEAEEPQEALSELVCNLDDMTPEAIAHAEQALFSGGALDVFATPVQMKKNRPAVLLTCLCRREHAAALTDLMLRHTTTAGVRETLCSRRALKSSMLTVQTKYGPIRVKQYEGEGICKIKPEYEDVRLAAEQSGAPFDTVSLCARMAYESLQMKGQEGEP